MPEKYTNKLKTFAQSQNKTMEETIMDLICKAINISENDVTTDDGRRSRILDPRQISDPLFADEEVFTGEAPEDLSLKHDDYLYGDRL